MPFFHYTAKKGPDQMVEDTIEAQSREEAVSKINQLGYLATRLVEVSSAPLRKERKEVRSSPASLSGRIKSRELTILTRQLASLLKSGVPILRALTVLSEQTEGSALKQMLARIGAEVKGGKAFSASLSLYPRIFPPLYISMVRAGEDSGNLQDMLLRVSQYRQAQEEIVSKVRSALAYPILMLITGIGTVGFMLVFVLPRMSRIFSTLGQELPLPTQMVLAASALFRQWGWALVLVLGAATLIMRQSAKTHAHRKIWGAILLKAPLVGEFVRQVNISRFCRTLEILVRSGIPILKSIALAIPIMQNEVLKEELLKCHKKVEQGGTFGNSLKQSKRFPPFMTNLIGVGEESGRLDEALAEIADSYEKDIDESLRVMTALFEPIMILVMGLVVGFIVVAMLLPVFEMNLMVT